ncbi:MAG: LynF/TruF/PatF family peptide O-prenyltransferase [Cyanothece sp. SIO1E1]|nr:LynF/TruF/PatF family peptide O-prenyltransferase [Cyanothece sp. SIO1E1]
MPVWKVIFHTNHKNLRHIADHKQAFKIQSLYPFESFEDLVEQRKYAALECSCKITDDTLHPARFNLHFPCNHDLAEQIKTTFSIFEKVESKADIKLDFNLFNRLYPQNVTLNQIRQVITGIDLRQRLEDSRLKIWFIVADELEGLQKIVRLYGENDHLIDLLSEQGLLLIGFDFFLSGYSKVKIYPEVKKDFLSQPAAREKLARILSPQAIELLEIYEGLHLTFAGEKYGEKILHYHLDKPDDIYRLKPLLTNYETVERVHNHYRSKRIAGTTVSLLERELIANQIKNLNLYYRVR